MPAPTDRVKCRGCNVNIKGQKHKVGSYWPKLENRVNTSGHDFRPEHKLCTNCCIKIKKGGYQFGNSQLATHPRNEDQDQDDYDANEVDEFPQQSQPTAPPDANQIQIPDSVCQNLSYLLSKDH